MGLGRVPSCYGKGSRVPFTGLSESLCLLFSLTEHLVRI